METKRINFKNLSSFLTNKELMTVMGGSIPCPMVTCEKTCGDGQTYQISCYGTCEESLDGKRVDCIPCNGPADGGGFILCGG